MTITSIHCIGAPRPGSSLEEFLGEDVGLLDSLGSHIELAQQAGRREPDLDADAAQGPSWDVVGARGHRHAGCWPAL